jgi:phage terminase large subunit-like protein
VLDSAVLTRRALRYVCDQHGLAPNNLVHLPKATVDSLQELVFAISEDMRYNQLKYFRPFDYQRRFFGTGNSERRGIIAANRIGKTVSTCFETAMHLTGRYPDWWNGTRINKPITAMVAGEGWSQVAMVLQNELLGTQDIKILDAVGTGAIPRNCIVFDTMRNDGANCLGVEIKHTSGSNSYLLFANYTQEVRQMQGFKLNLAVFDEQPPDNFFSEIVTRTATTQGQVLCSFTPLKGLNGLVSKFWHQEEGYEHIRVSWDDVPEYDPWGEPFLLAATRQQLERDYLPHERDARRNGIPVMGKGAVFQIRNWPTYKSGDYSFNNASGLCRVISLDLGLVNDKTVISLIYWDPEEQQAWLHTQIVVKGTEEANPVNYINHLMRPEVFGTPIVLPPDAVTPGRYTMNALSIRQLFEQYGLNVIPEPIMNPPDEQGRKTNHKSFGINVLRQMLEFGSFQVNENCVEFLREAQNYYVDNLGRFSDPDDCIDSARYGLLACLQGIAEPWDGRSPRARFETAKHNIRQHQAALNNTGEKPVWKRPWTADGTTV